MQPKAFFNIIKGTALPVLPALPVLSDLPALPSHPTKNKSAPRDLLPKGGLI